MWVVALCFSMQVMVKGPMALMGSEPNAPLNRDVQVAESTLLILQILVIGTMMVHCIENRRPGGASEKDSAENARAIYEKRLFLPSPLVRRRSGFTMHVITFSSHNFVDSRMPCQVDRFQYNL